MATENKQKLRVGIFTYDFYPWEGGVGRHTFEINEYFTVFNDVDLLIFSPCKNRFPNHRTLCAISKKIGKNVLFSIYLNLFIHRLIRKHHLDLIHIHAGSGGVFLLKKPKIQTLVTAHTNNYLFQYRRFGIISKKLLSPLEKITYLISDKIFSVSSYVRNNLIQDYQISPFKIEILPNGVNTDIFFPHSRQGQNANKILYVGRIYKGKGLEFLIDAMEQIVAKHPQFRLIIVGEGAYLKNINIYIQNKTVRKNIDFLGWADNKALNELYNEAAVYVMPSIVEGFGLTLLEAMACGCPVISTDTGGAIDIIRHGENGFLTTYGDKIHLSDLIEQLITDTSQRNRIIENGFKTVQLYTWKVIADKLHKLYTDASVAAKTEKAAT